MEKKTILVVDDEESMRTMLSLVLTRHNFLVTATGSARQALDIFSSEKIDLVITDIKMSGMDGIEMMAEAKKIDGSVPFIIMTAFASKEKAIDALNLGASFFVEKPFSNTLLLDFITKALELEKLRAENKRLKQETGHEDGLNKIIGDSPQIKDFKDSIRKIAPLDSIVLIYGESGTGKELVARAIHDLSPRSGNRFVSVNCGALPTDLLESELFGHIKGSFTGAIRDKTGLIEVADRGTFFLDEVGETSPAVQVKLLRVLEDKKITPIGDTEPRTIDVRLVAATNVNLEDRMKQGAFREDLYYRLNVIVLTLPPLRERFGDVDVLVKHFLEKNRTQGKNENLEITEEAMVLLRQYPWPGNVRELENVVERLAVLAPTSKIAPEHLPENIGNPKLESLISEREPVIPTMETIEKVYIYWILQQTGWQKQKAAEILGIDRSTLGRKVERYGLEDKV